MTDDYALDAVCDAMTMLGRPIVPAASADELEKLDAWHVAHVGQPLPDGYRRLLERCNGLNARGLTICGTSDGNGVVGLAEANERLNVTDDAPLRFYGQYWADFIAQHVATGSWALVAAFDLEPIDGQVFDSFDDVFAFAVALCLEAIAEGADD